MAKTGVVDTLYKDCIVPYLGGKAGTGSFSGESSGVDGAPPTAGGQVKEVQFDEIKGQGGIDKIGKIYGSTKIG